MTVERLEVRLDDERRRKLAAVAADRGASVSESVRLMIDEAYEAVVRARRREAARAIASLQIEDVPDTEDLARQLEGAYELRDLP